MSLDHAANCRETINNIKRRYQLGELSREAAKAEAEPVIHDINERGARIAKKWKKQYAPQTFIGLMR
jgi:hypothetical protein